MEKITINTTVSADKQKVWDYYTKPEHISKWNYADPSWHCPTATNDLKVDGRYFARMEAKDGSWRRLTENYRLVCRILQDP